MNDIFGDSDRFCTVEDTMEMKYLDCAIKESMRLYPSIPAIMRKLSEEVQIGILLMILLKSMFGYTAMQYFCCYCTKGDYKLPLVYPLHSCFTQCITIHKYFKIRKSSSLSVSFIRKPTPNAIHFLSYLSAPAIAIALVTRFNER